MSRWKPSLADDLDALVPAVETVLRQENSHKAHVFDRNFWHWQYVRNPSWVYVLRDDEGRIGGYYHVPVYRMTVDGEIKTAGVIQDVAVMPEARGRGEFRKLAEFAHQDLRTRGLDFIYTYPNEKSIHTFLKYNGYRHLLNYDAYLLPLRPKVLLDAKLKIPGVNRLADLLVRAYTALRTPKVPEKAEEIKRFNDDHAALFAAKKVRVQRLRSAEYLNWRYFDAPGGEHRAYEMCALGSRALVVYKKDSMFGVHALLIMEMAGDSRVLAALIRKTAHDADMVFAAGRSGLFGGLIRAGFFKVPLRFNPRPLKHLVLDFGNHPAVYDPNAWELSLGDWDVF
ncbi:MAG: GNAT family N-acetyltransferase [Bacteroidia bacterium]|nr:GNAT family N-acetyltransferase [Bacteroidia bacterium]MDW8332971.1 GNAT family N-acetyltransferase [Bacteroidia bacterium]